MTSARFRMGTAATNSAGTSWSWRAYDTSIDCASGSYVKVDLESTNGVRKIAVSIPAADEQTMASGVSTVTTVQASKTATFRTQTGKPRTYLVQNVVNDGIDQNGDAVAAYTSKLAVHIKTPANRRLVAVGETDEADRTYGYASKINAALRATASALGSSGVAGGTYTLATITVASTGVITSAASGALASSGVTAGTYTNATITVSATGLITSAATGSALASSGVTPGTYTFSTVTVASTGVITSAASGPTGSVNQILQKATSAWVARSNLNIVGSAAITFNGKKLLWVSTCSTAAAGAGASSSVLIGASGEAVGMYGVTPVVRPSIARSEFPGPADISAVVAEMLHSVGIIELTGSYPA